MTKEERMIFRERKTNNLFYPEEHWLINWQILITLILIFACCLAPFRIAFEKDEESNWGVVTLIIDFLFSMDILIIFNSAAYDDDLFIIEDRKAISINYLTSWFMIDLLSIIPFDKIL